MVPGGCPGQALTLIKPLRMSPTSEGPPNLIHLELAPPQEVGAVFAFLQQLDRNAETWALPHLLYENLYFSKICRGLSASMV